MECLFFRRRRICGASVGLERARREIRNPDMNANGYISSRSEKEEQNRSTIERTEHLNLSSSLVSISKVS